MSRSARLCLTASLLVAGAARAQPTVRFDRFGTERGLSQSTVTAIAQDQQGYLWVGTDDGLNRFDGQTFTVYRHALEDPTTLPSSRITALHVDVDGELWVGTMRGLVRLDRRTETFRAPPEAPGGPASPCARDVTALAPADDGALWAGTFSGGLCRIAPDRRSAHPLEIVMPDGVPAVRVYTIYRALSGALWARVSLYRGGPYRACRIEDDACRFIDEDRLQRSIPGTDDIIALRTAQVLGLARRTSEGLVHLPQPDAPSGAQPSPSQEIVAVPDGRVWVGTEEHGLLVISPETGRVSSLQPDPSDPRALPTATVRALFLDRQETIWVGTTQGLARWRPPDAERFRVLRGGSSGTGLSDERVTGVLEARDGTIYVGTRDGLNRIDPETGEIDVLRRPAVGPYPNAFWHLYQDSSGTLWMGSKRQGLLRMESGSDRIQSVPFLMGSRLPANQIEQAQVRYVGHDRAGRLWVGADLGFAVRTPDGAWHPVTRGPEFPLPSVRVNVFYEDRHGTLWAGTDGGLCRLLPEARIPARFAFHCYRSTPDDPSTLGNPIVWSLAEDARGHLWVGTVGGGLARYLPERDAFERLTTYDGLPNNTVYDLVADARGDLWATTNAGLARITPDGTVTPFTTADGLPSDEFDFMAAHVGPGGTVYVGGPNGLAWFDPERLADRAGDRRVAITDVRVFGREHPGLFSDGDTLRLGHDENFFHLTFSTLDLQAPERSRYRYRLAGYESEWRETGAESAEASYTRVPPGHYTFEVVGSRRGTTLAGMPTRLLVVVAPAFWQTAWSRGTAVALVLIGCVTVAVNLRRRRENERARQAAEAAELKRREAEGRERERTRLARELHDGPVQDLYRLGHDLDRLRLRRPSEGAQNPAEVIQAARERVTVVTSTLRDVLAALRPPVIPHLGLPAALEALARRERHRQLDIALDIDEAAARSLPDDAQNAVYRIIQEALTNVMKHADARAVLVTLVPLPEGVEVVVQDDGCGFSPPSQLLDLARTGRFGVVGASERAEGVGGHLAVESTPGDGTRLRLWLPTEAAGQK